MIETFNIQANKVRLVISSYTSTFCVATRSYNGLNMSLMNSTTTKSDDTLHELNGILEKEEKEVEVAPPRVEPLLKRIRSFLFRKK